MHGQMASGYIGSTPTWPGSFGAARINNPSTTNQLCFDPQSPRALTIKARYFPSTRTAHTRSLRPLFLSNGGLFLVELANSSLRLFRQLAVTNVASSLNPAPLGPRTFHGALCGTQNVRPHPPISVSSPKSVLTTFPNGEVAPRYGHIGRSGGHRGLSQVTQQEHDRPTVAAPSRPCHGQLQGHVAL